MDSIVSFMGNDGDGSTAALPSAPLRARYSEGCLVVRNSEPKETGDSVWGLPYYTRRPRRLEMRLGVWMYHPRHPQSLEIWSVIRS